jgi:hypothetical protein
LNVREILGHVIPLAAVRFEKVITRLTPRVDLPIIVAIPDEAASDSIA